MVFEVTQALTITMNSIQQVLKTRFDVHFLIQEKEEGKRTYLINKSKVAAFPIGDNNYLKIVEDLEFYTYPIKIQTNDEGNFLNMIAHKEWLHDWKENSKVMIGQYSATDNIKDIINKYYDGAKDEKAFIANRFKEPYWNLLFFNPPIDNPYKADLGTTLNWNIKSIGIIPCVGKTKLRNPASEEVDIYFEALQKLPQNIIDGMKSKTEFPNVKWEELKATLQVASTFDTINKKLKRKKALFEFKIDGYFSYVEETTVSVKNTDN
jgi:hypothetical protein